MQGLNTWITAKKMIRCVITIHKLAYLFCMQCTMTFELLTVSVFQLTAFFGVEKDICWHNVCFTTPYIFIFCCLNIQPRVIFNARFNWKFVSVDFCVFCFARQIFMFMMITIYCHVLFINMINFHYY